MHSCINSEYVPDEESRENPKYCSIIRPIFINNFTSVLAFSFPTCFVKTGDDRNFLYLTGSLRMLLFTGTGVNIGQGYWACQQVQALHYTCCGLKVKYLNSQNVNM